MHIRHAVPFDPLRLLSARRLNTRPFGENRLKTAFDARPIACVH